MSNHQQNYGYEERQQVYIWSKYPWRQSYIVWIITGATLLGFLAVTVSPNLYAILALSSGADFHSWQLLTASFTEGGFLSLLGFLMLQLTFGIPLEHEWARRDLAIVYLLSGIGSSLLLLACAPQVICFASPMGAIAGLLAAAWRHLPNDEFNVLMIIRVRMRTIITVIMLVAVVMCLISRSPIVVIVPLAGFALGIIYCLLEKQLQKHEATRPKVEKSRISNIEID